MKLKLICIDDVTEPLGDVNNYLNTEKDLTWGKEYEIRHKYDMDYYDSRLIISIVNDLGIKAEYFLSRFITLEDFRELQLNKLGL